MQTQHTHDLAERARVLATLAGVLSHHHGVPAGALSSLHKKVLELAETLAELPHVAHLAELVHDLATLAERAKTAETPAEPLAECAKHLQITAERLAVMARPAHQHHAKKPAELAEMCRGCAEYLTETADILTTAPAELAETLAELPLEPIPCTLAEYLHKQAELVHDLAEMLATMARQLEPTNKTGVKKNG